VTIRKVLISGGNGLLGRATVERLSKRFEVTTLVREVPVNSCPGVEYINLDLSSDWDLSVLPTECDLVIHLAQSNKYKDFPHSALEVFDVNLTSTVKLLEYGRQANIQRFILASTGGLYPQNSLPLNERSDLFPLDKLSHYLGTKLSAEIFANNYLPYFLIDTLRIFFMYGPGQKMNMLVPKLVTSILDGNPVLLPGGDGIKLNPIFVQDVVSIIEARIPVQDSSIINVAGQEIITIRELANRIGSLVNKEPIFEVAEPQLDLISESSRCLEMLSGKNVPINEGLTKTIDWIYELRSNS
jgi:UDP-glucose 4-epimerase